MVVYLPDLDVHVFHPFGGLGGEAGELDWRVIWVLLKGADDGAAEAGRCAASYCYDDHEYDDTSGFLRWRSVVKASSVLRPGRPAALHQAPRTPTRNTHGSRLPSPTTALP